MLSSSYRLEVESKEKVSNAWMKPTTIHPE
jgi:hypothetical protein